MLDHEQPPVVQRRQVTDLAERSVHLVRDGPGVPGGGVHDYQPSDPSPLPARDQQRALQRRDHSARGPHANAFKPPVGLAVQDHGRQRTVQRLDGPGREPLQDIALAVHAPQRWPVLLRDPVPALDHRDALRVDAPRVALQRPPVSVERGLHHVRPTGGGDGQAGGGRARRRHKRNARGHLDAAITDRQSQQRGVVIRQREALGRSAGGVHGVGVGAAVGDGDQLVPVHIEARDAALDERDAVDRSQRRGAEERQHLRGGHAHAGLAGGQENGEEAEESGHALPTAGRILRSRSHNLIRRRRAPSHRTPSAEACPKALTKKRAAPGGAARVPSRRALSRSWSPSTRKSLARLLRL